MVESSRFGVPGSIVRVRNWNSGTVNLEPRTFEPRTPNLEPSGYIGLRPWITRISTIAIATINRM
jgi:hypothetical protein